VLCLFVRDDSGAARSHGRDDLHLPRMLRSDRAPAKHP